MIKPEFTTHMDSTSNLKGTAVATVKGFLFPSAFNLPLDQMF